MYSCDLSVIITCYNEAKSIDEFHARLSKALSSVKYSHEIIYVNDGSSDDTFEELQRIFERDNHVAAIIDLFNNCGQAAALTAGFAHARGKWYATMDSDLQLAPEELPRLLETKAQGYDMVGSYRVGRKDSRKRRCYSLFLRLVVHFLIPFRIRDVGCNCRVFEGDVARAFDPGPYRVFRLCHVFERIKKYTEIPLTHYPRKHGESGWTLWKMMDVFVDNLIGYIHRPFLILGSIVCLIAPLLVVSWILLLLALLPISETFFQYAVLTMLGVLSLVMLLVMSAIGEFVIRAHSILAHKPAYIRKTLIERERVP